MCGYFFPEILAGSSSSFRASILPPLNRHLAHCDAQRAWVQKYCRFHAINNLLKRQSESDDSGDDTNSDGSMMTTLKGIIKKLPQINFYSSIPNGIGVIGQGYAVLEYLSDAFGTPLPYFLGTLPITLFGIACMFVPDFTNLNIPGFYPNGGGDNDPLGGFPPRPNLDNFPDLDLSLTPGTFPPRIIPATPETLKDEVLQVPENNDSDSPTDPESFQAPRKRLGETLPFNSFDNYYVQTMPQLK